MNRDKSLHNKRVKYVKNYVEKTNKPTTKAVAELSKKLFLAESTIWGDLAK